MPSAGVIGRVPAESLHVLAWAEFGAVWSAAGVADTAEEGARNQTGTWYATGVVITCRLVALAIIRPPGGRPGHVAFAPVTKDRADGRPELIEKECEG
jgi:hypothetical protein